MVVFNFLEMLVITDYILVNRLTICLKNELVFFFLLGCCIFMCFWHIDIEIFHNFYLLHCLLFKQISTRKTPFVIISFLNKNFASGILNFEKGRKKDIPIKGCLTVGFDVYVRPSAWVYVCCLALCLDAKI